MNTVWGFDLGTASIGLAVVQYDGERQEGKVVKLGVRVFPEGVEEKRKEPRNWQRRSARLARRQIRRRRWRKRHLRAALVDAHLMPESEREPSSRHTEFFSHRNDPYQLRARGVRERLDPHDIGRALFHLAKHRAFRGSVKLDSSSPADKLRQHEEGKIRGEIEQHQRQMKSRTVGQYLDEEFRYPARQRGHHFQRNMIEDEFRRLWECQLKFHPRLLTEQLRELLRRIIFFQRPTFFRLNTIGRCELEPSQDRCLKGDWYAQRFVMLQMLNSLKLSSGRALTAEQRAAILSRIEDKAKVSFTSLRKALGLDKEIFNFEVGGKKEMLGNVTEQKLAKVFGQNWSTVEARERIRDEIAGRLWRVEYRVVGGKRAEIRDQQDIDAQRQEFAHAAEREWNITPEQAEALSKLDLPDGHASHSKAAILKILPYLEQGFRYDEAKPKAYPDSPAAPRSRLLPSPPRDVRNPTVMRTLNELRNVANNLLRVYGRPDLIRVELARDLKLSRDRRRDLESQQTRNKQEREEAEKWLAERNIQHSGANIEKYLLATQQGWRCPYTGNNITCEGLFQTGLFEVDHILPRSRSFDNAFGNKVVCHRDANREKARRTPYEAWGNNSNRWTEILTFLADIERSTFPAFRAKSARIKTESYPEAGAEDFTHRQLVDTAYASRCARGYLESLRVPVEPGNGRVTHTLRHLWGLDRILSDSNEKTRDDHRHHAIDALVVALTTPAFVKRASEYYGADIRPADGQLSQERIKQSFAPPWTELRANAERAANDIIVSHRAQRKVSGALHDEQPWGDTGKDVLRNGTLYRQYVQRRGKPGDDKHRRVAEPKQCALMRPIGPDGAAWVATNSNHHMLIYKKDGQWKSRTVSMFDAAKRLAQRKPIVDREPEPGASEVASVSKRDMLQWKDNYWVVKVLWPNGQMTIQPHNAAQNLEETSPRATKLFREGARKVVVNPIGRVFSAND